MSNLTTASPRINVCAATPAQLRAARGMLGWSRIALAKKANLSAETIKNIEHGIYSPKEETIKTLVEAFSQRGIEFVCHKASVITPDENGADGHTITFSYLGIVCMTASVSKNVEEAQR